MQSPRQPALAIILNSSPVHSLLILTATTTITTNQPTNQPTNQTPTNKNNRIGWCHKVSRRMMLLLVGRRKNQQCCSYCSVPVSKLR
ncbi:hypothetical protein BKA57DRAFT_280477 [Linnemannia elongata]|nr:hypothetical protein BKA57DRAFT_280477 [Linnemannia elongata]